MLQQAVAVINRFCSLFVTAPTDANPYSSLLDELNSIVIRTAQDEEYRITIANNEAVWKQIRKALESCTFDAYSTIEDAAIKHFYLRSLRGILLLLRNLSVSNQATPQKLLIQNDVVHCFLDIIHKSPSYLEIETTTYSIAVSFLHNVSKNGGGFDKTTINSLIEFLKYPMGVQQKTEEFLYPYLLFSVNMVQNEEFLYYFFRHEGCDTILNGLFMQQLVIGQSKLISTLSKSNNKKLGSLDVILLKYFSILAGNESYATYLEVLESTDTNKFIQMLKTLQLVITSQGRWDKFQLTGIMTWAFRILQNTAHDIDVYFNNSGSHEGLDRAEILHNKISSILDIISNLSEYEHVQKYLIFYKGLEVLITLFGVFQKNLLRLNFQKDAVSNIKQMKAMDSLGAKIVDADLLASRVDFTNHIVKPTNFPECKLMIVEILAHLAFENKEVQDRIRELHGLELVLSNCVIDDNDPFIKERAIMCIRFLLQNNQENQKIVAQLEAKSAVQDDTLAEAGYEVKIGNDGKIGLVSKGTA